MEKADVIHNTTTTHWDFADRIKILLFGKSITRLEIETGHEICIVKKSTATTHVPFPEWLYALKARWRHFKFKFLLTERTNNAQNLTAP